MVRNYSEQPVPQPALERILQAAQRGPSAGFSQGVAWVVVQDPTRRSSIAQLANEASYLERGFPAWLTRAPIHLILTVDPQRYRERYARPDKRNSSLHGADWPVPYWYLDAGAAMMLVLLAAVEEGLAAGFQGSHNLPGLSQLLHIPSEIDVLGLITLGYPAPDRRSGSLEQGRRPPDQVIHRETWKSLQTPS